MQLDTSAKRALDGFTFAEVFPLMPAGVFNLRCGFKERTPEWEEWMLGYKNGRTHRLKHYRMPVADNDNGDGK